VCVGPIPENITAKDKMSMLSSDQQCETP